MHDRKPSGQLTEVTVTGRRVALCRLLGIVVALALLSLGCRTEAVRRAALVPHLQPTPYTGQPMGDVRAAIKLGSATIAEAGDPEEVSDANAGIEIPRWHGNAAVQLRVGDNTTFAIMYDHGFAGGARKLDVTQPDPDNGDVSGLGVGFHYSIPTSNPGLRIGLSTDLVFYSIPFIEYRSCLDFCGGGQPITDVTQDRETVSVLSVGFIPSWKIDDRWTFYGSITLRNHPTVDKKTIENVAVADEEPIESGPFNVIGAAGAEFHMGGGWRAAVQIYQPIYASPATYLPTMGVSFTIPLARVQPRPSPTLVPPPPPVNRAPGSQ